MCLVCVCIRPVVYAPLEYVQCSACVDVLTFTEYPCLSNQLRRYLSFFFILQQVKADISSYLARFSQLAGNFINCAPVLNWLEVCLISTHSRLCRN